MRILIAEDDTSLATALQHSLRQSGYAVDWVDNGALADQALKDDVFDLLILDLGLPRLDGLDVLRRLRRHNAVLPVLILSGRESPDVKAHGLDIGADDYLVKPFSLNELQARVRALLRRRQVGTAPTISYGRLSFDTVERIATIDGSPLKLSLHEVGVLEVLLSRRGRIISKQQMIEHLYSYDHEVGGNAIEVYVSRLRRKIEGAGITVRSIYGRGYLLNKQDCA